MGTSAVPPIVVMASEQVPCGARGMVKVSLSLLSLTVTVERSTERFPIVMDAMSMKFCPRTVTVVPVIGIMELTLLMLGGSAVRRKGVNAEAV